MPVPPHAASDAPGAVLRITRLFEMALALSFAVLPSLGIAYLRLFQDPQILFMDHVVHEVAIAMAILVSALISLVTWKCYQTSGETFLRWLTLGFLSFTIIYAPHGVLTRLAHDHTVLFLYFGPVSRLTMAALFLVGLFHYGRAPESDRKPTSHWFLWIAIFLAIDLLAAIAALSPVASRLLVRATELAAIALAIAGLAVFGARRIRAPLVVIFALSLAGFAQSSVAFLFATPWNHLWWYAHFIFAAGFLLLSYGVLRAFHTTRAFSRVYSQEEMMEQLRDARDTAVQAFEQLSVAHARLEELAVRDSLTGASNRRHFLATFETEMARARRHGSPLSVIMIDIDHFKAINDTYGHAAGDAALAALAHAFRAAIRPGDLFGRIGGEEFSVLLPNTFLGAAASTAERFRCLAADLSVPREGGEPIRLTISAGVAHRGTDGDDPQALLAAADRRLYRAKASGRNRVVAD